MTIITPLPPIFLEMHSTETNSRGKELSTHLGDWESANRVDLESWHHTTEGAVPGNPKDRGGRERGEGSSFKRH